MFSNEKDEAGPIKINILYQIKISPQVLIHLVCGNGSPLIVSLERTKQEINPASNSSIRLVDSLVINAQFLACVGVYVNERHHPCPLLWRLWSACSIAAFCQNDGSLSFPAASNHLRFTAPRLPARREGALIVSCKHTHTHTSVLTT